MHPTSPLRPLLLPHRAKRSSVLAAAALALVGCASVQETSSRFAGLITPYRIEVVQGNFISREQVEALQVGQTRAQVREILGTPLLESVFHADRWDYVFSLKRQGLESQSRRLTVFFKDDRLERHEGDTMPTEAEFVATLAPAGKGRPKAPVLEVAPAELDKAAAARDGDRASNAATGVRAGAAPGTSALPASPRVYPPLENPAANATPAR